MGVGCSSLLARPSSRSSLCPWLCPTGSAASNAKGRQDRQDAAYAIGCGNDVVVMPLQNPPDVIEAHQRYYSSAMDASPSGIKSTGQTTVKYSYFSASANCPRAASLSSRPRRPGRPGLDSTSTAGRQGHVDFPGDRTLPTQHQHPSPRSPSSPRHARRCSTQGSTTRSTMPSGTARMAASMASSGPRVAERPRCRRQGQTHSSRSHHGHNAASRANRTTRGSWSRTCRASRTKGPPCSRGTFGYDIQDVDSFLGKASLEKPANIPMVLTCHSTLYRTEEGGWQEEVPLPLGMVVNGVFRVDSSTSSSSSCWLYAQTPHGHEGYVRYASCLPLGILATQSTQPKATSFASAITLARSASSNSPSSESEASSEMLPRHRPRGVPRPRRPLPTVPTRTWGRGGRWGLSWDTDTASDIFPATLATFAGNRTDIDKAQDTRSERGYSCAPFRPSTSLQFHQGLMDARRAERSVDELYLRSIRSGTTYGGGSISFSSGVNVC